MGIHSPRLENAKSPVNALSHYACTHPSPCRPRKKKVWPGGAAVITGTMDILCMCVSVRVTVHVSRLPLIELDSLLQLFQARAVAVLVHQGLVLTSAFGLDGLGGLELGNAGVMSVGQVGLEAVPRSHQGGDGGEPAAEGWSVTISYMFSPSPASSPSFQFYPRGRGEGGSAEPGTDHLVGTRRLCCRCIWAR